MAVMVDGATIVLTGTVGDLYWDDSFSAADVIMALAEVGAEQDVTVRLNSGGGIATEGSAIYAALVAHAGKVAIVVEGIAASAASIIAMAGEDIAMAPGSVMMVHDPSSVTLGTAADHQQTIKALNALGDAMASVYARKTGKTPAEARTDMQTEIWMTPDQAVEAGYAHRVLGQEGSGEPEPTAFDYRLFKNAPERLLALADARSWAGRTRSVAPRPLASTPQSKDPPMPNDKTHTEAEVASAAEAAARAAATTALANAAEIATLCTAAGVPTMTAALLKEGVTPDQAKARIDGAKDIRAAVDLARKACPMIEASLADSFIAAGTSLQGVREQLFQKMTAVQSVEIANYQQPSGGGQSEAAGMAAARASMERELKRMGMTPAKGA